MDELNKNRNFHFDESEINLIPPDFFTECLKACIDSLLDKNLIKENSPESSSYNAKEIGEEMAQCLCDIMFKFIPIEDEYVYVQDEFCNEELIDHDEEVINQNIVEESSQEPNSEPSGIQVIT